MKRVKRNATNSGNAAKGVLISSLTGTAVILIMAALIAWAVASNTVDESAYSALCASAVAVSVFAGCLVGSLFAGEQLWISISGGTATILVMLLCVNALLFDGTYPGIGMGLGMVLLGAAAAVLMKIVRRSTGKKGKFKYRYR